jgi:[acyl-carrier-protein] S-malonyltransferase
VAASVVFWGALSALGERERRQPVVSEGKIFLVFPGQGSQYAGMGSDLVEQFPAAAEMYDRASEVLGYDMRELSFSDRRGELGLTRFTQPALLTHQMACLEALRGTLGATLRPALAGGHSLGEYTALVAAGALTFEQALALVAERGRLMSELGRGGMLATPLDIDAARQLADKYYCAVAASNLPEQTVIAGDDADLDALLQELATLPRGKRSVRLNTEGAFHTFLMVNAAVEFRTALEATTFAGFEVDVLSNYTGARHEPEAAAIRSRLFFQLFNPVRWVDCMNTAIDAGVDTVVEVGGGIGSGAEPAEKRPNLESMIKKSLKARGLEARYLAAIHAEGIRTAAEQLAGT